MSLSKLHIEDKVFVLFLSEEQIQERVGELAGEIQTFYAEREFSGVVVMNGAAIFAADLMRQFSAPKKMHFIRTSSYQGMKTTGKVEITGISPGIIEGKHVLLIEDIIDTGLTMYHLLNAVNGCQPASVEVCALLYKPASVVREVPVRFRGFEIENQFVVGYGLDYNDLGRNLRMIYRLEGD